MDEEGVHEQRLPQITLILSPTSTEEDAKTVAREMIRDKLYIDHFEILHVELIEEGQLRTRDGMTEGRLYNVAFRHLNAEVIFVHPDYDAIMKGR